MESVEGKKIRASSPLPWLVSPVPTNGIEAQLLGIRVRSCLRCYKGQGGGRDRFISRRATKAVFFFMLRSSLTNEKEKIN